MKENCCNFCIKSWALGNKTERPDLKSNTLNYVLRHSVRLVFCSTTLPDDGNPVRKYVGVLTLVMNCILLSTFVG